MEKQAFIFNSKLGSLEKDTESFMCEPFLSACLKQGDVLIKEEDFIVVNEVAVSGVPVRFGATKKEQLVCWLADQIREFKKEESITAESRESACQILTHILATQQTRS